MNGFPTLRLHTRLDSDTSISFKNVVKMPLHDLLSDYITVNKLQTYPHTAAEYDPHFCLEYDENGCYWRSHPQKRWECRFS